MLGQLHIKNIGIIEDVTINFTEGLNIMTGETGAGKSLVIDSLNAITGSRISKEIVKTGCDMALVEACFFTEKEDIILVREIYPNGKNLCKINGRMVTVSELKELGESLVDLHGQHDNQSLLNTKTHMKLLDGFAGEKFHKIKVEYEDRLHEYRRIKEEMKASYGDPMERVRKIELLKYQSEEIRQANLKVGEEERLVEKRNLLMNAEKIASSLNHAYEVMENSTIDALGTVTRELQNIAGMNEKYASIQNNVQEVYYMVQEYTRDVLEASEEIEFNEVEQRNVEERLDFIYQLKRKYGNTIEEILNYWEKIDQEIQYLENSEQNIQKLQSELEEVQKGLKELALNLRQIRKKTAEKIESKINMQLQDLEMKKASIKIEFKESKDFHKDGLDEIEILIATNLGDTLKPLAKIASGGEISRVMLAIKTVLSEVDEVPTMVFDEIDTGISGQAGKAVAQKLQLISKNHQILCVTHLPMIAAAGNSHYFIEKKVQKNKTVSKVKKLEEAEVVKEIARIIAGNQVTDTVLKHAKELRIAVHKDA